MSNEIFDALSLLEKERGIPVDFMMDKIKKAILTACKNSYGNDDATIDVNPETGAFEAVSYTHLARRRPDGAYFSGRGQ